MSEKTPVTVQDNTERHRFEALDEAGVVAGFAAYRLRGDVVVFTHTEVDDAYEGQGVGSTLVRGALDEVRASGRTLTPLCPFVKSYIAKHPEYADLVA